MAALHHSPRPESIEDLEQPVTYNEASALLARTGHDARPDTIRRWVKEDGITTVSVRGRTGSVKYVDWSDVLTAHFKRTAAKLRASSDWP
ncbi:hypothetical protein SAM23877_p066 (plasmid) [Streptomyces ambofaciens ATCC 23877]|uniref:Uncharacterized protein n=1 Tax=Streptomyces ambofaciens (strain ATCC 23877 / 3486 / DSM 40053 / JCM 4204 / NBRC 12836 / NRRL B-2516) TaxID=278992 RepID=A0A0K2B5U3_STRA7|nr:hypothetical protein [Streptomyces ambofaciens]AKZ60775.1 hypothetical protein SAM23877_p066 [Streptomyces ambofaciens ATCC 23877]